MKVERPLRLHSQVTGQRIEALRFASGDEELRAAFYAELGDALVENWAATLPALEKLLADWSDKSDKSDSSDEDSAPRKGLPDSRKKDAPVF